MPRVQFVGQSARDPDNISSSTSRLMNCYLEPVGGRSQMVLKSVLSMAPFANIDGVFTRAAKEVNGLVYIAHNGGLYEVNSNGTVVLLGAIDDSEDTTISGNDGKVTIATNGKYYVWDGTDLTQPTSGAFSDFGSVTYFGSLTILTERNGNRVQWSDVYDPSTLGGLSFATADAYNGAVLRAEAVAGSVWIFKDNSIERWYQNGADLAPIAGGAIEFGLKAHGLIALLPNAAFFVSSDSKVRLLSGEMKTISTRAVETALTVKKATHCFFYQDEGHDICVIRFSDASAWCYDIATGMWHERAEGRAGKSWSAIASVKAFGEWHVVTAIGNIFSLKRGNTDANRPLIREATGKTLQIEGNPFVVSRVEVQGRTGRSDLPDGRPATVELSLSRDHGETFGDPKPRSMGKVGEYRARMIWRSLGQFQQLTPKITWADAAEITIDADVMVDIA